MMIQPPNDRAQQARYIYEVSYFKLAGQIYHEAGDEREDVFQHAG